ncbi:MAG: hypothetical protein FJY82_10145 [Candidatus Aminicenantes bacterium]|nr:hypothetical protein [Candidatus Aminicenantes bacterium]
MSLRAGLIGTITSDTILYDDGRSFRSLGGVLYQAAVFCGLGLETSLFTNCGEALRQEVEALTRDWPSLRREGIGWVPGPGHRVELRYSDRLKEREEVLLSAVPPLEPSAALAEASGLGMLLLVFNSGFDLELSAWRRIAAAARCPVWLDVHSLVLAPKTGSHREYVALADWREWMGGVSYLQANRQEVASLLGHPERWPEEGEYPGFWRDCFDLGIRAVFVTLGKEGVLVAAPGGVRPVRAPAVSAVVDTTGCGDVFAASTLVRMAAGADVFSAAAEGASLASAAAGVAGVRATFELVRRSRLTAAAPL